MYPVNHRRWNLLYSLASVGRSGGNSSRLVSASVMEADGVFEGFSYVPPAVDASDYDLWELCAAVQS